MQDNFPQNLSVGDAQAVREAARQHAIFTSGHKFIWLTLKDYKVKKLSGIEYVHSTPYVNEQAGGIISYQFDVRGGQTDFQFDPSRGVFRYAMLDSEFNRRFLASHYHHSFWHIEDDQVRVEIEKAHLAIADSMKVNIDRRAAMPVAKTPSDGGKVSMPEPIKAKPVEEEKAKAKPGRPKAKVVSDLPEMPTVMPPGIEMSDLVTARQGQRVQAP
jgi:hypothetical protein